LLLFVSSSGVSQEPALDTMQVMQRVEGFAEVVGMTNPDRFFAAVRTKLDEETSERIEVNISDPEHGPQIQCIIGGSDGIIFRYSIFNSKDVRNEPGTQGKTIDDAISEDEAFAAAKSILEFYGLPLRHTEYTAYFLDSGTLEAENDLAGSYWTIQYQYKFNDIPCRQMGIRVVISPLSGKIVSINFEPRSIPERPQESLSKEESIVNVLKWLKNTPRFSSKEFSLVSDGIIEVIAPEIKGFTFHKLVTRDEKIKLDSKYCWEIPLVYTTHRHESSMKLWANQETGEVVGGEF
jgi:hypothetical protein